MSPKAASAKSAAPKPKRPRPKISQEKGNELLAVGLIAVGLLLLISLVSHYPSDPSFFHQSSEGPGETRNWAGPVGAQISAVGFGLLGLTCLVVPLLLVATGVKRFRGGAGDRVVGRGLGAGILLVALPGLLQLALGGLTFRGGEMQAGGAFGRVLAETLEGRFNVPGALLVLLALVIIGSTLLVQSTLGEVLSGVGERLITLRDHFRLRLSRRREQKDKERARQRVVQSHVEQARVSSRQRRGGDEASPPSPELPAPPIRVVEKKGEGSFGIRKVKAPAPALEPAPADIAEMFEAADIDRSPPAARSAPLKPARPAAPPQNALPFAKTPKKGSLPPVNLLNMQEAGQAADKEELLKLGELIRLRCAEFGVEGTVEAISPGPVITVYEFQPAPGVKVSQIVNLQDDLALSLKAESVRIDRLAGRSTLGIEVPNDRRLVIRLGSLLERKEFKKSSSVLSMALGVDIHGEPLYSDLATMPHLLVAGATGAGKSVGLQSMITSILYKARQDQVQFIFIDPKRIELGVYADIPYLATPVVVEPKQAANALSRMVLEMENRYKMLAKVHVRSIAHFNHAIRDPEQRKMLALNEGEGEITERDFQPMPYIVIIIDELADLMMVSSSEVETAIARLAQMARAVGIHLIVATQRPSVDVLTGTIKANFPCRIAYATATRHDSRTILDQVGAEKLLGKGDMLFMPPGTSRVMRLHGAYITEQETASLIRWLKKQGRPDYDMDLLEPVEGKGKKGGGGGGGDDEGDELFDEAARLVVAERMASASFLQRRMRIGFSRASRLIDMMERDGLLGPPQGSKPREVLVPPEYFQEIDVAQQEV